MSDSFDTLLADGVIDAVLGQLKTGKEAEVWLVQHANQVVAAKVYKERHARNFRNNAGYKEGREVRNTRTRRAMEKGTRFGQTAAEEAWKSAEADALYTLHAQGVRVPTPVMFYEGVLLMELVLDAEGHAAPRLVEAPPASAEEAHALYLDLRAQVVRMLCADLIHGDLSAYNILRSWAGPVIIDFPQTVAAARNSRAEFYFQRDLDNVRTFLAGYDARLWGMAGDTGEIWDAYVRRELTPDFIPSGAWREGPRHGRPRAGFTPGRNGAPRGERRPLEERRGETWVGQPVRAQAAPAASGAEPLSPEEAELRQLEAMFLRQGGGERGKPPPSGGGRDGRRRPFAPGGAAPRGGVREGPAQGGVRNGSGAQARQGGSSPQPLSSKPPNATGQRTQPGEQRTANGQRAPAVERSNGVGPRVPTLERRNRGPARPPAVKQRPSAGPRTPIIERRDNSPARLPVVEQRRGAGPRMPIIERRDSSLAPLPVVEQRSSGATRPPMDAAREAGVKLPAAGGLRGNGTIRPAMEEVRRSQVGRPPVNGSRSPNRPGPASGGTEASVIAAASTGRSPNRPGPASGEPRDPGGLRPPRDALRGGDGWTPPAEPHGTSSDDAPGGERRENGPRRPPQGPA